MFGAYAKRERDSKQQTHGKGLGSTLIYLGIDLQLDVYFKIKLLKYICFNQPS